MNTVNDGKIAWGTKLLLEVSAFWRRVVNDTEVLNILYKNNYLILIFNIYLEII